MNRTASSSASGGGRIRPPGILVVDDMATDRERMLAILRRAGWRVRGAETGVSALSAASAEPPDIILMDIVMPDMDGFEACRRLGADPRTRSIPVIFVSTKSQRADHLWARMQGGRELLPKPFTPESLLAVVARYAPGASAPSDETG